MSSVRNVTKGIENWVAGGLPITMMMNIERRHGADKPVIRKALVELEGPMSAPFKYFAARRDEWAKTESYTYPNPTPTRVRSSTGVRAKFATSRTSRSSSNAVQ